MKKLMRFCLPAALLATALNTHASDTSLFTVESKFSKIFVSLNKNLSQKNVYHSRFIFSGGNTEGFYSLSADSAGAYRFADVVSASELPELLMPSSSPDLITAPVPLAHDGNTNNIDFRLCRDLSASFICNNFSESSNYTPSVFHTEGGPQTMTLTLFPSNTGTASREDFFAETHPVLAYSTHDAMHTAFQAKAAATLKSGQATSNITDLLAFAAVNADKHMFILKAASITDPAQIQKCEISPLTAGPRNCIAQAVDLSGFTAVTDMVAGRLGRYLLLAADGGLWKLSIDQTTGQLTGGIIVWKNTGAALANINKITLLPTGAIAAISTTDAAVAGCAPNWELVETPVCRSITVTSSALIAPTAVQSFKLGEVNWVMIADGTKVRLCQRTASAIIDCPDTPQRQYDFGSTVNAISSLIYISRFHDDIATRQTSLGLTVSFFVGLENPGTDTEQGTLRTATFSLEGSRAASSVAAAAAVETSAILNLGTL